MEEFLEFVIRQLIDYPDEMVITRRDIQRKVIFHLQLRQSDVGKVIGKHGHTIAAIRNLLSAAAARQGQRANLQIVEEGEAGPEAEGEERREESAPEERG